jgi:hypothetical protein
VNWGNTGYAKKGHCIKKNHNFLVEIPVYYHVVYFIPVYYWHTPFGCAVVCGLTIPIPGYKYMYSRESGVWSCSTVLQYCSTAVEC